MARALEAPVHFLLSDLPGEAATRNIVLISPDEALLSSYLSLIAVLGAK